MASIKKHDLGFSFEYNFLLYGIVSTEKPYRLAWFINKNYPFQLIRISDYELTLNNSTPCFARYHFSYEENHLTYDLLANKDEGVFLLQELKQFDFLMVINGAIDFFNEEEFKQTMNQISAIQMAYPIDVNTLKFKHNLLYL